MQTPNPASKNEPTNRFVLRKESGHPGFCNLVVLGTESGLSDLANSILSAILKQETPTRVVHYVTREHRPASLGTIAFETISEEELVRLQQLPWKKNILNWCGRFFWMAVMAFTIIGIRTFWHWVVR